MSSDDVKIIMRNKLFITIASSVFVLLIGLFQNPANAIEIKSGDKIKILGWDDREFEGNIVKLEPDAVTLSLLQNQRFESKYVKKAFIWKKNRAVSKSYGFLFGLPAGALLGYLYEKEIKNDYTYNLEGEHLVKKRTDPETKTIVIFALGGGFVGGIIASFIYGYEPIRLSDLFRPSIDFNAKYNPQKQSINLSFSYSF